jgi:hypothetical protein
MALIQQIKQFTTCFLDLGAFSFPSRLDEDPTCAEALRSAVVRRFFD